MRRRLQAAYSRASPPTSTNWTTTRAMPWFACALRTSGTSSEPHALATCPAPENLSEPKSADGLTTIRRTLRAMPALCAAHPDWTATADLMVHEAAPLVNGPAILESHRDAAEVLEKA